MNGDGMGVLWVLVAGREELRWGISSETVAVPPLSYIRCRLSDFTPPPPHPHLPSHCHPSPATEARGQESLWLYFYEVSLPVPSIHHHEAPWIAIAARVQRRMELHLCKTRNIPTANRQPPTGLSHRTFLLWPARRDAAPPRIGEPLWRMQCPVIYE